MEVYAMKALKIKSLQSLHLQGGLLEQHKNFTTQVVSLSSCDLFLAGDLAYMQEQQNCFLKT